MRPRTRWFYTTLNICLHGPRTHDTMHASRALQHGALQMADAITNGSTFNWHIHNTNLNPQKSDGLKTVALFAVILSHLLVW
jgi:hypothetical protein